jgi:hypothetical protein
MANQYVRLNRYIVGRTGFVDASTIEGQGNAIRANLSNLTLARFAGVTTDGNDTDVYKVTTGPSNFTDFFYTDFDSIDNNLTYFVNVKEYQRIRGLYVEITSTPDDLFINPTKFLSAVWVGETESATSVFQVKTTTGQTLLLDWAGLQLIDEWEFPWEIVVP